jgi:hypothetical protein
LILTTRAFLATGLTLLACIPAAAQAPLQPTRPERPYRGMFASGVDNSGQSLTATSTLSGGYDDNILADATGRNALRNGQGGTLGQLSAGLNYTLSASRASVNAGLGTSIRYYPSLGNDYFKTYNASIGGQVQLFQTPNVTLYQSVSYRPFTFLSAFPDAGEPVGASSAPEPDFVPIASQYMAYAGGVDLNQQLSRRLSFNSSYGYGTTDRTETRFLRQTGSAGFQVGMTRDLSLRLGYRYTRADYRGRGLVETHRPDVGLDFRRALSLTRRTSLTFGVGTEASVYNETTRFRATGNATVTHEIGRSWSAVGAYQRGTSFVETLSEPIFGDSGSVTLVGLVTRRIQFQAVASGSTGHSGFSTARNYNTYRGSVGLSTALTRFMNIGIDYAYYNYKFDALIELEPGVPRDLDRQSVRAHVTLWAPLLNRSRTANASR